MPKKTPKKKPAAARAAGSRRAGVESARRVTDHQRLCVARYEYSASFPGESTSQIPVSYFHFEGTRLGKMMDLYERYFVNSLRFKFVPSTSLVSVGSVELAFDWDVMDAVPYNEDLIASYADYAVTPIRTGTTLTVRNKRMVDGRWLAPAKFVAPASDLRLSSFGKLLIRITSDEVASFNIGYIDVYYDIVLEIPAMQSPTLTWTAIATADPGITAASAVVDSKGLPMILGRDGATSNGQLRFYSATTTAPTQVEMTPDTIYRGTLSGYRGASGLQDSRGRAIGPGTTLFWRSAEFMLSAATDGILKVVTTGIIGALGLDPQFVEPVYATADTGTNALLLKDIWSAIV